MDKAKQQNLGHQKLFSFLDQCIMPSEKLQELQQQVVASSLPAHQKLLYFLEQCTMTFEQVQELQQLVDASSVPAEEKAEQLQEIQQLKALYVKEKEEPELER